MTDAAKSKPLKANDFLNIRCTAYSASFNRESAICTPMDGGFPLFPPSYAHKADQIPRVAYRGGPGVRITPGPSATLFLLLVKQARELLDQRAA